MPTVVIVSLTSLILLVVALLFYTDKSARMLEHVHGLGLCGKAMP